MEMKMTPANVKAAPAAVFSGMAATEHDALHDIMGELNSTRCALDGALALLDDSEHTDASHELSSARALFWDVKERLRAIYNNIDHANIRERNRQRQQADTATSRKNVALEGFGHEVCQRASAVQSMLLAALELMRKHNHDQNHKEIFQSGEVIEAATTMLNDLCGDAVDAEITMAKRAGKPS